jgi:hypothetical protein
MTWAEFYILFGLPLVAGCFGLVIYLNYELRTRRDP